MAAVPTTNFGNITLYRDNPSAPIPPNAANDAGQGYSPGSRWYDSVGKVLYMCTDNSAAAAVWFAIAGAGLPGLGTVAGGASTISGGGAVSASGGALGIFGGSPSAGNNNGGALSLGGGAKSGSGVDGSVVVVRLPTANPSIAGALYAPSVAGAVSISRG